MKITLNSNDTYFHIDTYSTFDFGGIEEDQEIENHIECLENEGIKSDFNDFEIEYDFEGYKLALADASIDYILMLVKDDHIIKDIVYLNNTSPKFYNYTTDSYTAEWTYNKNKLKKYILDHYKEWQTYTTNEWSTVWSNVNYNNKEWINNGVYDVKIQDFVPGQPSSIFDNQDCIASMLDFYTKEVYKNQYNGTLCGEINEENYLYHMLETANDYEYFQVVKKEVTV
jgi:hypothetical protein